MADTESESSAGYAIAYIIVLLVSLILLAWVTRSIHKNLQAKIGMTRQQSFLLAGASVFITPANFVIALILSFMKDA